MIRSQIMRLWRDRRASVTLYSRMIRWMRVVFPILAVLLIAAIFLFNRKENDAIFSPEEIARMGAGMRLENPHFTGKTDSGDPFSLRADRAVPDSAIPNRIELDQPRGTLTLPGEITINGRAKQGLMQRDIDNLTLAQDVVLTTSDGYRAESEEIVINLASKDAKSSGKIRGFGPRGLLEAGSFRIEQKKRNWDWQTPDIVLFFEDGVRVVLTPEETQ